MKESSKLKKIISYMDEGDYNSAHSLAAYLSLNNRHASSKSACVLKADLAGLLIDIGIKGLIEKSISEGLQIIKENRSLFSNFIPEESTEYNLGNAKSGLFRIKRLAKGFKFSPRNIGLLTDAKNHYWKSYKISQSLEKKIKPQLLVNLANTLDTGCRVVEAIQYYDEVLFEHPDFPQANASRSEALIWLNNLSNTYSVNLLWQAKQGFAIAAASSKNPEWLRHQWNEKCGWLQKELLKLGHDEENAEHDIHLTKSEEKDHSRYRKFSLNNRLCLSEHSIYCKCAGATCDNLSIPTTINSIGGDFIPEMELRLNRLKSEFSLARYLYYKSDDKRLKHYDGDVAYTELFEDENIGLHSEMLRTSFRLCFGILDKIALAVCDLFDLSDPDEPIAFERFWRPRGKGLSKKQQERWNKINTIENFPLLALYSQATDLDSRNGEWGEFKAWRNALEHGFLILTRSNRMSCDPFNVLNPARQINCVDYYEFKNKTLHLLRLTRSAIFNFVFCVRAQGELDNLGIGIPATLQPKL